MEHSIFYPFPTELYVPAAEKLSPLANFCIGRHAGRMYGEKPFRSHLEQVYSVLAAAGAPPNTREAAWAHDAIEEDLATKDEVRAHSNDDVADQAWAVSGFGANRAERLACVVAKCPGIPDSGLLKQADRFVNVVNCIDDERWGLLSVYLKEDAIIKAIFPGVEHPLRRAYDRAILTGYQCLSTRHNQIRRPRRP